MTTVSNVSQLNAAILAANAVTTPGTVVITFAGSIALGSTALDAIELNAGVTLDIIGNSDTLDGGGTQRGLFVYSGSVSVENLTINDAKAIGGAGCHTALNTENCRESHLAL